MKLRQQEPIASSISTLGRSVEQRDLATVIKVSKAVSGEMVLEELIDTLMRTAIEHAGAEGCLLILLRGDEQRIEGTSEGHRRIPAIFITANGNEKLRLQALERSRGISDQTISRRGIARQCACST